MRKKYQHEEQNNHERWLVSYADFITLLFAFFVVMYSLSSINEGKYRVLSNSLDAAFRTHKTIVPVLTPVPLLDAATLLPREPASNTAQGLGVTPGYDASAVDTSELDEQQRDDSFNQQVLDQAENQINQLGDEVENNFTQLVDDELINVKRNKFWLEVEIKSKLLFPSGSSELLSAALPVLENLSKMFVDKPNRIHIEGFTDNVPINTPAFPSNWELSAARAATVVRLFESNGVAPRRMASIGYGEHQPITENITEEDRARNRRVVMVVMAAIDGRKDKRLYEFDPLRSQSLQ